MMVAISPGDLKYYAKIDACDLMTICRLQDYQLDWWYNHKIPTGWKHPYRNLIRKSQIKSEIFFVDISLK